MVKKITNYQQQITKFIFYCYILKKKIIKIIQNFSHIYILFYWTIFNI